MLSYSYLRREFGGSQRMVVTYFSDPLVLTGTFLYGAGSICHEKIRCEAKIPADGN